ncbi:MAG: transglutaminaseTgpA domain-containing protein, partial [Lentimonas sp.]
MRKKLVKLTTEELFELKWLVGTLLGLLALWALSSLDMQGELYALIGAAAIIVALFKPALTARIPTSVWRPLGFALMLIVGADFILNLPEFMPPLLRMVILLLLYKTFAPRQRRDDLQIVLLCLFCLVISGVMTVSLLFAVQILLFTPVAMGMLFLICVLDRGPESRKHQTDWESFTLFRLVRRLLRVLDYRVLFLGVVMFVFVVAVSTVLFILTPRVDIHQAIPYLQIKSEASHRFGGGQEPCSKACRR